MLTVCVKDVLSRSGLYETRQEGERQITLERYQAIGGMEGVLKSYLLEVLNGLPEQYRKLAQKLLIALLRADGTKQALSDKQLQLFTATQKSHYLGCCRMRKKRFASARLKHEELVHLIGGSQAIQEVVADHQSLVENMGQQLKGAGKQSVRASDNSVIRGVRQSKE